MNSALTLITIFAAVALSLASVRPKRGPSGRLGYNRLIAAINSTTPRLLALHGYEHRRWFLMGVAGGVVFAVFCNLVPFFRTIGAYGTDGFEIIGFPLVFRAAGGFAFSVHFYWLPFAVDLLFATVIALVAGYAAIGIRSLFCARTERN